ncbi:MAG: universal stress protein [Bacteroidetes bacterium]|nr:universal stress protein [Bacteroidota bacterium]
MNQIKKILMPTDFSKTAQNAMKYAIELAWTHKAKLTLMHVVPYIPNLGHDIAGYYLLAQKEDLKRAQIKMKELQDEILSKFLLKVKTIVKNDYVQGAIVDYAKSSNTDLIIMGTHGVTGIKEFFIGSNSYGVVNQSHCPVITIHPKGGKKNDAPAILIKASNARKDKGHPADRKTSLKLLNETRNQTFKTIVLPVRIAKHSREKVLYIVQIAKKYDSFVHIAAYVSRIDNTGELRKVNAYAKQVEKYLKSNNIKCRITIICGANYIQQILKFAEKRKADLITIMAQRDYGLSQYISGPYAQQLVNHSKIPVLSVPVKYNPKLIKYYNPVTASY